MTTQSISLFVALNEIARNKQNDIALLDSNDRSVTYQELMSHIERAHHWLQTIGLRPGDSLIALLPNAIETAILFLASLRAGLIYAPLPCTATLPEILRWKKRTRATTCLLAMPISNSLQSEIKELDWRVETIQIGGQINWPVCEKTDIKKTGTLVMQSSGSTGEPKAILLSGDRLWHSAVAFLQFHQVENNVARFWNYLPMSYLGGLFNLLLIPLAAKGSIYIDDAFNGKTFLNYWSTIERYEINTLWLVPSILRGLIMLSCRIGQQRPYPTIRYCFLGTAPALLAEKKQFFEIFGITPLENYGLSETTFISSEHADHMALRTDYSVGSIMPNIEVQLRPAAHSEKKETDEIWVKTPYALLGYLNEDGSIESPFDDCGFIATGDFGSIIHNQLLVNGRQRDIIKKGGMLILLREIENIASTYPKVIEVAAVRMAHDFYGESFNLYLCIEKSIPNQVQFLKEFNNWLHKQLVKDKWPENILLCHEFPKTASGKIQKHLLQTRTTVHA